MTLTELCNELKKITYGESSDELSEVAAVVNMSLARLYSDTKPTAVYSFYKSEILPIMRPLSFHKKGGCDLTLPLAGRAYGMHLSGKGSFRIITGSDSEEFTFDTVGDFFSGIIDGAGEICFTGNLSYDVYSLSFYDEIGSEDLSDIPTGYPKRYDLLELIPYFDSPVAMPRDDNGVEIDGAEYIGSVMFIPPDYKGRVSVEYRLLPQKVSEHLADEEIRVDPAHVQRLLHLCAYYSLLESEERIAAEHLEGYRALLVSDVPRKNASASDKYVIEDGWA